MNKKEWQIHHGFNDEDMWLIELALSIVDGKITKIMQKPLKYQHIKIKIKIIVDIC